MGILEETLQELKDLKALLMDRNAAPVEEPNNKPESTKSKGKTKGKGKGKTAVKGSITVESVKAQAKKIALASDDPKECMNQIREVVGEVAEGCYENANVGINKFDITGLTLLQEELTKFVYNAPNDEKEAAADDLEI